MAFLGGTMIIFSLISGVIAIITAVMGVMEGKKDYKEGCENRIVKYNAYIEKKKAEIEQCRLEEQRTLEEIYIAQETEKKRLESFSPDLFDRCSGGRRFPLHPPRERRCGIQASGEV